MNHLDQPRRQLSAPPLRVFSRLPLLGRVMIVAREEIVALERIGIVERLERDGDIMFCVGKSHDSEIDLGALTSAVVDYTGQMKGKVMPKIEFQDAAGKMLFSVVGLEGADKFTAALDIFEGTDVAVPEKPAGTEARLDPNDVGMAPLKAAREAGAEIIIEVRRPGLTQRWRGIVPEINPAMGFVNIITSDFHLHLRGGGVAAWQRGDAAADGTVELAAVGPDKQSLGLYLRGAATAFGPA